VKIHNLVNKDLGKTEYSEMDAIGFYHALGDLNRSPVWTPQDIDSLEYKQLLIASGGLLAGGIILGGIYYAYTR